MPGPSRKAAPMMEPRNAMNLGRSSFVVTSHTKAIAIGTEAPTMPAANRAHRNMTRELLNACPTTVSESY